MMGVSRALGLFIKALAAAAIVGMVAYALLNAPAEVTMTGVVTARDTASVSLRDQYDASEYLLVDSVEAPGESWVVAYRVGMAGMPGTLLGYAHVGPGASRDVRIELDPDIRLSAQAIVVLHADRGVKGRFEFDEDRFDASPDKPYYVDGQSVSGLATVALPEGVNTFQVPDEPMPAP